MSKVGIQETKEVLLFGLNSQKGIVASKADGQVNWMDAGHLFPVVQSASAAFNGINKLKAELLDIDDQEQAELSSIARQFYADLSDEQCKALIEETIDYVINGVQLGVRWSNLNRGLTENEQEMA